MPHSSSDPVWEFRTLWLLTKLGCGLDEPLRLFLRGLWALVLSGQHRLWFSQFHHQPHFFLPQLMLLQWRALEAFACVVSGARNDDA
jgi:hypothetical protein